MTSLWQHDLQFDRPEIWTLDLLRRRRTRYCSTNLAGLVSRINLNYFIIYCICKIVNLINAPSIFNCVNFAFGNIEGQIVQKKLSLFLSIYYVYLIPIRRVNITDKGPQENFF